MSISRDEREGDEGGGHLCGSRVRRNVFVDPLLDVLGLDLTSGDDGRRISGIGTAEIEVMGALLDDNGNDRGIEALSALDAASAPWIELTVAKDDVCGSGDVETTVIRRNPSSAWDGAPNLLAIGAVVGEIVGIRDKHVCLSVGSNGHDHLRASLVGPSEITEIRSAAVGDVVAGSCLARKVVEDGNGRGETCEDCRRVVGGGHALARHRDGPSWHGGEEISGIRIIDHRLCFVPTSHHISW